ncbi:MAG TPA: hypothetical protein PLS20_14140 [Ruminococcus flavefaciens]|nr:hypothetical protein [Ruminococcus flavefaciens]
MANEQNLMPISEVNSRRTREEHSNDSKKAGIASGKARKRKADLRRMAQEVLDGTFKDKHGKEFTGEEAVIQGLVANLADPKGKNWGKAMDLLVELLSANKSREEKQMLKAQIALIKAKTELLNVSDDSVLEKLDDVLKQIGE